MTTQNEDKMDAWDLFSIWADRTFGEELKHEDPTTYNRMFAAFESRDPEVNALQKKLAKLKHVGWMSPEECDEHGVTGPVAFIQAEPPYKRDDWIELFTYPKEQQS